jgi:hypothetical protein
MFLLSVFMNGIWEYFLRRLYIWMESVNVFIICLYEWHLGIFSLLFVYMNGICECFLYCFLLDKNGICECFLYCFLYEWFLWMFSSRLYIWMESVNVFSTDCFVEWNWWCFLHCYRIGGVMLSVLPSSAVDRGFEPRSGQTKVYAICICCFFAKHAALRGPNPNPTPNNNPNPNCNISIVTKWKVMDTARWLLQYLTSGSTKVDSTRSRTGWLWIRIMCPNREACLSADCYFFVLGLSGPHRHLIEN